jgi:hypothetical protein
LFITLFKITENPGHNAINAAQIRWDIDERNDAMALDMPD